MIVLDASVVVELLTNGPLSGSFKSELAVNGESFIAPHLLDIEVMSALRGMITAQHLDRHQIEQILIALVSLPVERYPHSPLLGRIWELRHNFTAYDAAYIALAEATNSVLYTCDAKLSKGHRAQVALIDS